MTPLKNLSTSALRPSRAARPKSRDCAAIAVALLALFAVTRTSHAASAIFTANPTDANWATGANWSTGVSPGNATNTLNNDVATFNTALAPSTVMGTVTIGGTDNPIVIDAGRTIGGITFDTATVGAYQIGTNAGNALRLSNNFNGANSIQLTATVTSSQIIAAPLVFAAPSSTNGAYTFQNNSTTAGTTLTLSGAMTLNTSASRPGILYLNGTNTSANTLSGVITSPGQGQLVPLLVKRGTGTWILSGTNLFSGTAMTDVTTANYGIQILDGVLSARNNQAFGTNANANANQVYIGNKSTTYGYNSAGATTTVSSAAGGGTLELANGITLDNGVRLNLFNGGTIRSNGSNTSNAGISLSTVAATNATLSTTNATDIFTVGNAGNDLTGGAADTVLNISGPGTVFLSQASNYAGTFLLNSGTTRLGSPTALGAATMAMVAFGSGSTGRLQLNGNNATVASLTSNAATVGTPVVENGLAGTATLTINNAVASTFGGVLQDGAVGTLALTKSGTGALTLTGASTYSGATTISGGTVFANNASGSATGTGAVAVSPTGSNATILSGNGTIVGGVTVASGARVSPGAAGTGSVGNLTVGALTLSSGSNLDFDITNTTTLDRITVTGAGGLTINGGQLNINGATATFTTNGVYNLIAYNGAVGGTGVSALTLNGTNQDQANNTYTFGLSGSYVTLTIASSTVPVDYYTPNANSAYSNGANWSAGTPPNAVGAFAGLGGNGSAPLTANRTITVDGAYTVGTVAFNSTTGFGYTLADGGAGTGLTLNNGASTSFVSDTAGTHAISAALALTANGATFGVTSAADTLAVSGVMSSTATTNVGLTKTGNGTLALTGANTYFGGTALNGGTIQINSALSLGDTSSALTFGGGTLQLLADVTSARNYQVSGGSNAVIDTNGHLLALSGTLTPVGSATGGLVKNGLGTLSLSGTNTYTGVTTVTAGILNVNGDAALGTAPAAAATNLILDPGTGGTATLQAGAALTLGANRNIVLNSGTGSFDTNGNNLTVAGVISGAGLLQKDGAGILTINATTTQTGGTTINAGTLLLANNVGLNGNITIANGATFQPPASGSGNNITIAGLNANATVVASGISNAILGTITGTADQTLTVGGTTQFSFGAGTKQFQTMLGTVELPVNSNLRFSSTSLNNGGDNTTFDVNGFLSTRNNGAVSLGALTGSGTVTTGVSGASPSAVVYTVGSKGIDSLFSGVLANGDTATNKLLNLTKTGIGTLTLTGANTYTGPTTISAGTLQIGNGGTTGSLGTGSIVDNATLAFNRSDSYSIANVFTGTGTLTFLGTGTKTFTGSTALTTFNVSAGTLIVDPVIGSGLAVNALVSTLAPNAVDNATVTVQNSGSYNVNSANLIVGGLGTATLNVNGATAAGTGATGGMVTLQGGLTIGNSATAVGRVNLNAGGTLNTPSIVTGGGSSTLNLNGGTLIVAPGATGTFITGLTAANVQAGGAIINDSGNTVSIAQVLRHDPALGAALDGGLTKVVGSTGILTLAAANTYNGGTTINAGTLAVSTNGGLATGNVTVAAGATLSLGTGVTFAHNNTQTTALTLVDTSSVINLAAGTGTVQDVVGSLTIGGTSYPAGFYGSSTSGAMPAFQLAVFTGDGLLDVGIALVPEPSTYAMLIIGLGGLAMLMARGKRVA